MLNLPNILTLLRIGVIPVILALFMNGSEPLIIIAFVLYVLAAATDFLDGYLARKLNIVSAFGRFLDPIADKLLIASVLVLFCAEGLLPGIWSLCAMVILFREILISGLREFLAPHNVIIHVTILAKWKTTIQLIACAILLIAPVLGDTAHQIGQWTMAIAAALTAITGWDYLCQCLGHMRIIDKNDTAK